MHARKILATTALLAAACPPAVWGRQAPGGESLPPAIHLVGHEDAALLARVQAIIDDWDPRKLRNPYVAEAASRDPGGELVIRRFLTRADLGQFVADVEAAEALGKAFFWEMQAGSDFRRLEGGRYVGTACASCHYRFGADARNTYTTRIPYVAWDRYSRDPDHPLEFGEQEQAFPVERKATESITDIRQLATVARERRVRTGSGAESSELDEDSDDDGPRTLLSLIVGSQGVEPRLFDGLSQQLSPPPGVGAWSPERSRPRSLDPGFQHYKPEWAMFIEGHAEPGRRFRQITSRNSPSVHNAVFADRLFHDGKAESTFNGISIFGDFDRREVLFVRRGDGRLVPVRVAIPGAALASQAVGPIVNEVEMSYLGRGFPDLAAKLLDAPVLGYQEVAADDSHLGRLKAPEAGKNGLGMTYRQLIRRAFRAEWWDGARADGPGEQEVELRLAGVPPEGDFPRGELMRANFSLYWGLSILLYEASLVSDRTAFDSMMRGDEEPVQHLWEARRVELGRIGLDRLRTGHPAPFGADQPALASGSEVFQRGFRLFLSRGCVDCHSGPLFSEVYSRDDAEDPKEPIARTMEHTLLPNSRADAIAARLEAERRRVADVVASELRSAGGIGEAQVVRMATELDLLRGRAHGQEVWLQELVSNRLQSAGFDPAKAEEIARVLMTMEKTLPAHSGDRHFFGEDERLALAELLGDPVLVERMAIPDALARHRRPLPISGPPARAPYAFYDLGFYNLGVSPPRYDRGNGTWNDPDVPSRPPAEQARMIAQADAGPLLDVKRQLESSYKLADDAGERDLARDIEAGAVRLGDSIGPLRNSLSPEARAALGLDAAQERVQSASGTRGSAYRLKPEWRRAPRLDPDGKDRGQQDRPRALAPAAPQPIDPDDEARRARPRDVSWFRDLPHWDRLFPAAAPPFDSLDKRRADIHFFSRARALVQNEEPWGHRKPFLHDNELAFWGTFKTPTLRNVELTRPYMHNGRLLTLADVIDFYDRGGDVPADAEFNPDKHPAIRPLDLGVEDKLALVFFLWTLTDERVRHERGPFDHPALSVVNGYGEGFAENWVDIPATGSGGVPDGSAPPVFPASR
jgi:cytochrome c peroxidase